MQGAPAGVSQDLQQFTRFKPGSTEGSLVIQSCAAIARLVRVPPVAGGPGFGDVSSQYNSVQLNLTDPAGLLPAGTKTPFTYMTPIFDLIGSAFVRYRMKKLIFHYEPQSSATTTEQMVFAFANDPLHPVLWNSTIPTPAALLSVADSIAFAPWRAWSMNVSKKVADNWLYTFSDTSTTVAEFVERFSDFGVMSCVTNSAAGTTAYSGVLYAEMEFELKEFCPISVTRPSALRALASKVDFHLTGKADYGVPKRQEDCDEDTSPGETQVLKVCQC